MSKKAGKDKKAAASSDAELVQPPTTESFDVVKGRLSEEEWSVHLNLFITFNHSIKHRYCTLCNVDPTGPHVYGARLQRCSLLPAPLCIDTLYGCNVVIMFSQTITDLYDSVYLLLC